MTQTIQTRYLSIDVGIRNFAYCVVDIYQNATGDLSVNGNNIHIIQWEKIDLLEENDIKMKSAKVVPLGILYKIVYFSLMRRLNLWQQQNIDVVLMEQQIGKSRNAKTEGMVAMWLYAHLHKTVYPVSPQWKLQISFVDSSFQLSPLCQMSYHHRKEYTVNVVNQWLLNQNQTFIPKTFFTSFKASTKKDSKQDDLADCFVQAVAWHLKRHKKHVTQKKSRQKDTAITKA